MKDAYSFDVDKEAAEKSYDKMFEAYLKIFRTIGLKTIPARAPSGAIGGDLTHEFNVIADGGESDIFFDPAIEEELAKKNPDVKRVREFYSATDEVHEAGECPTEISEKLKTCKTIEIGHIFYSGTKYTKAMNTTVTNEEGKQVVPHCGCYGIGVSRIVAALIEASYDDKGIVWPESVAPFQSALINLHTKNEECCKISNKLYEQLETAGLEVLYDDSSSSPGSKLASNDLIGLPWQIIVSTRLIEESVVEIKNRKTNEVKKLSYKDAVSFIEGCYEKKY